MALDFAHYAGREQAFVKHTFLDKYLPALIGRIASRFPEFVYVDGFAGPWKSVAGQKFEDTSFGIALRHMTAQKAFWASRNRSVRMRAILVERDDESFKHLVQAATHFPSIDVTPLFGRLEEHVNSISSSIPKNAFLFSLIDPKGFPQINAFAPLLDRDNAEAMINFMFDFANRFANTDLIPALEDWLSTAITGGSWRDSLANLSGQEREEAIERLVADNLKSRGNYKFAPVISVDKVTHDRTLYKLVFLSRHIDGLKVFRDSQYQTLTAQAMARSLVKAKARVEETGVRDLFSDGEDAVPHDRSSKVMRDGQERAKAELLKMIVRSGELGISWAELWPPLLTRFVVTHSLLGHEANRLRKYGEILAPAWPSERRKIPEETQKLISVRV